MKSFFFSSYLITDPIVFGDTEESLSSNITKSLSKHKVDMLCFRDKKSLNINALAKTTLHISKQFNVSKVLINGDISLAIKLVFDGVHLASTQFEDIKLAKRYNLFTIISCHNEDEVKLAKALGCDAVTYSPIFFKEDKGVPKGVDNLKRVIAKFQDENFSIIALGGIITDKQIEEVRSTSASGFGSIRYFKSN